MRCKKGVFVGFIRLDSYSYVMFFVMKYVFKRFFCSVKDVFEMVFSFVVLVFELKKYVEYWLNLGIN